MDVAVEAMYQSQVSGNGCEALHRIVRVTHHTTAEKQSLDIVAPIELHRDLLEFADRECGPFDVVRTTVDAVGAVVHAVVGQHHLQQRDTTSSANEWQMPTPPTVEPTIPCLPLRTVPLDEHDTSYFADSARMRSFSIVFSVSMDAKIHKVTGKTKENIVFFAEFPKIIRIFTA